MAGFLEALAGGALDLEAYDGLEGDLDLEAYAQHLGLGDVWNEEGGENRFSVFGSDLELDWEVLEGGEVVDGGMEGDVEDEEHEHDDLEEPMGNENHLLEEEAHEDLGGATGATTEEQRRKAKHLAERRNTLPTKEGDERRDTLPTKDGDERRDTLPTKEGGEDEDVRRFLQGLRAGAAAMGELLERVAEGVEEVRNHVEESQRGGGGATAGIGEEDVVGMDEEEDEDGPAEKMSSVVVPEDGGGSTSDGGEVLSAGGARHEAEGGARREAEP